MKRKEHSLWIERFRPLTLDTYVGNDALKERISTYIGKSDIPHLIFTGTAGGGKTTLAKIIVNNTDCDYIYINASDSNGIDTIREKIKGFAEAATFRKIKIVVLDEADFLTQPAQSALRNLIEENSLNTRFILTCNYIDNLIEPLQSRCEIHKIVAPPKGDICKHIALNILDKEQINYTLEDLAQFINDNYPDIRSTIKNIQAHIKDNQLIWSEDSKNYKNQIVDVLKSSNRDSWSKIRQIIINENLDDYNVIYRNLFDKVSEFSKGNDAEIIVNIDEYLYRSKACPDKEICFSACILQILKILNTKRVL